MIYIYIYVVTILNVQMQMEALAACEDRSALKTCGHDLHRKVKADAAEEEIEEFKKPPLAATWATAGLTSWKIPKMENWR